MANAKNSAIDAIGFCLIFVLAFAAFGILAGGFIALPLMVFGKLAYTIGAYAIGAYIAFRVTLSAKDLI